jgi:beta-lactamase superfamily II metal-dependent hydrolase
MKKLILLILPFFLPPVSLLAHQGGVDSSGGHFDSQTQQYHCHRVGCVPLVVAPGLSIFVIDVGQGDSTLVVGPDANMLIDAGDNRAGIKGAEYVQALLSELGIDKLNYVVLSHYDVDHMGGFVTTGTSFKTSLLWNREGDLDDNPVCTAKPLFPNVAILDIGMPVRNSKARDEWRACVPQLIGEHGPWHFEIYEADDLDVTFNLGGGYTATIVTGSGFVVDKPGKIPKANSPNEMSISVLVSGPGEFDFLVTGDLIGIPTNSTENALLETALGDALHAREINLEVLRVGHHGAANATNPQFIEMAKPEVAIISVGDGNSHGHPHCNTLKHLLFPTLVSRLP